MFPYLILKRRPILQDEDGGLVHGPADVHHPVELRGVRRDEADLSFQVQLVPERAQVL